jgi:iron(II)-dependent oxidoreductase
MLLNSPVEPGLLYQQIDQARAHTDALFNLLRPDSLYERPIPERHRLIFYLGHLEAFDWNQLCRGVLGMPSFNPEFDKLFELGIDPEEGKLPSDQPSDWPSLEELHAYNARVREAIDRRLCDVPEHMFQLVIEHRYMHAETLSYLFHNLGYEHKTNIPAQSLASGPTPPERMIEIPAGRATLGQAPGEFGWDNEFDMHSVDVPTFRIAQRKVTNGDYLEFVRAGAKPPHFWTERDGQWFYRGMFEMIPLPHDWPVYATEAEATAYAAWRGRSIMSEPQFHRAAYGTPEGRERSYPWGDAPPSAQHGNFDFHRWDPISVNAYPAGDSAFGVSQMAGNAWEWTSTPFAPFPGFRTFDFYPTYSKNFFDGDHYVIKGASPRTAAVFLRRSFRNWFRSHYPYVYAGFRLVEN